MRDVEYLEAAELMGWHLCDFFVPEGEFATHFVFTFFKNPMMEELVTYTSFKEWANLNKILMLDQRAVTEELDSCLKQAEEITDDLNPYTVAAYVEVNEYALYCFERLKKYVDEFYFDWELGEETIWNSL